MSETKQMTKAAGTVSAATLVSRILGFVRDMIIAGFFGSGPMADVFIAAFRIPNLLRRLLGEGTLSISFVPVLTGYLSREGKEEAFRLVQSAFWFLSVLLITATVLGILSAPWVAKAVAYGYLQIPGKMNLTITLMRIMIPYVFFIGMVALSMGVLNVLGHFAAPALAPVFLNLSMIGSILGISYFFESPEIRVYGLAFGVLVGGVLQLGIQLPFLFKKGFGFRQSPVFFHPGLKKIGTLFFPVIIGASVFQINTLVGTLLASFGPEGSVTHLYLADRLVQFPLGVFGLATATAALPSFARQVIRNDYSALKETFRYSMNMVLFIMIPSMVGLIILREPIVTFLFQRGLFTVESTRLTAHALLYYTIGLWAFSSVRIVVSVFHAIQDTRTPLKMAFISIIANLVLGVFFLRILGYAGVALSLSLASIINFGLLMYALRSKLGPLGLKNILQSAGKNVISSMIMGLVVWNLFHMTPWNLTENISVFYRLFGSILAGLISYGVFSFLFKSNEMNTALNLIWYYKKKR